MAVFCHFWHMRPCDFWALSIREYAAMAKYMHEYSKEVSSK